MNSVALVYPSVVAQHHSRHHKRIYQEGFSKFFFHKQFFFSVRNVEKDNLSYAKHNAGRMYTHLFSFLFMRTHICIGVLGSSRIARPHPSSLSHKKTATRMDREFVDGATQVALHDSLVPAYQRKKPRGLAKSVDTVNWIPSAGRKVNVRTSFFRFFSSRLLDLKTNIVCVFLPSLCCTSRWTMRASHSA